MSRRRSDTPQRWTPADVITLAGALGGALVIVAAVLADAIAKWGASCP